MQLDNALYALVQIAHNFGALAAVGLPLAALRGADDAAWPRKTYLFTSVAWIVQIASGVGFGLVSCFVVGETPQISGLAFDALVVKIACAALSIGLTGLLLGKRGFVSDRTGLTVLGGLGATALFSAAILRWFS
ncbi:hypothetical protein [Methylosinus sp. Sm6]|uniref:hypothetical protein n=1 Tax=Methylosinus sp. Sm6 TaxID=2866948 RepID=UPI001C991E87|nr:hypothetical protein [Methylosinus sp. Sm6]MBY6239787.1 hypothetical protein [Methylosinus sp. Sm6]